jgi:hypothetical protein
MNILREITHIHAKWFLGVALAFGAALPAFAQNQADSASAIADQPPLSGVSISASEFSAKNSLQYTKQNARKNSLPDRLFIKQPTSVSNGAQVNPSLRIAPPVASPIAPAKVRWFPAPAIANQRNLKPIPTANRRFLQETPVNESASGNDDFYGVLVPTIVPDVDQPDMEQSETQELTLPQGTSFSSPSDLKSERVVPVPVQPAPGDLPGFEPKTSQGLELPEPRRIFPLPKVERIAPPPLAHSHGNQAFPGSSPLDSGTLPSDPNQGHILQEGHESKHKIPDSAPESPQMANDSLQVPFQEMDFSPIPFQAKPLDPQLELQTYTGKLAVETQRPWVEWWRPFYTGGMYEPGVPVFSDVNLLQPSFLVYGDYRTAVGIHRDQGQAIRNWAHRLNLDMDLRFTGTERFHLFTGPLDHNGRFTRLDFSDNDVEFEEELDFQADTAFFEGDLGAITGSLIGDDAPFDLPFTCGLVPLLYQNGIWMEDAIAGFALGTPWKHNRELNISNFEATFFAGFNQVTSPAFQNDNNDAAVYGTAWFLEAYQGYIETDYAYLDDFDNLGRSYHNAAIAYTRRYFGRISNSIRLIGNAGQSGPANTRTADGGLLLFENSLISSKPSNVVPYWNFFVGSGRPQSVARAGNAGGILRNTGINFETDALTGYPTLNATGANAYGGAIGVNVLSADFRQQWIGEFAALDTYGDPLLKAVAGPQYALGTRYQRAINNRSIWRIDLMNGWLDRGSDIYGMRTEFRWKF